jgi:hypothetical protein
VARPSKPAPVGRPLVASGALVLAMAGAPAGAIEWDFVPRVELGQYWTDNVTAAPKGFEESEWITALTPGFSLRGVSPRGQVDLQYQAQALWYQDNSDFDDVYHNLLGNGQYILVPNRLFVDGFARYDQENIDPFGRLSSGNIIQTGNRTDVAVYGFSPWYTQSFGDWGETLTRFTYYGVRYQDTDDTRVRVQDSDHNAIRTQLGSQQGKPGLSWLGSVGYQRTDFLRAPEIEYGRAALDLGYPVGLRTRATFTAGLESNFLEDRTAGGFDEEFWAVGFEWEPSEFQSLAMSIGDRFFGTSFEMHWRRRGTRGDLDVSYTEVPSTANQNLIDGDRGFGSNTSGLPALDADLFLAKRLSARATYNLPRTRLAARLYAEDRERPFGEGLDDEVYGLRLSADWDAAVRTRVNGFVRYERRDFGETRGSSNLYELGAGVRRDLTQMFFTELRYSFLSRDFNTGADYDINTVGILFGAEF